ncbi:hypothetical protein E2I00_011660, partial [Balaenoptera physalus]
EFQVWSTHVSGSPFPSALPILWSCWETVHFFFIILVNVTLHEAMYLFLAMLATIDLGLRDQLLCLPGPDVLSPLLHCHRVGMIAHYYCEHMAVVRLACGDTHFNNIYGIAVAMFIVVLDLLFIILSYFYSLPLRRPHYKVFGTYMSHIGAILAFYTLVVISSVMHRVACWAAPPVHIFLANFYLLFTPMVNPIIYEVKTKQIRERVLGLFLRKDV